MSTKHLLNIGRTVWDKTEVYWERLGNNSRIWRTPWEHDENILRTRKKKQKKNSKRKNLGRPSWVHAEPSHWPHKISIFNTVLGDIVCPLRFHLSYLTFFIWMQQKMQVFNVDYGEEQLWKEKFHAANGKAQHALMNGPVSFFLKWGRRVFVFFSLFPMCSYHVPMGFS